MKSKTVDLMTPCDVTDVIIAMLRCVVEEAESYVVLNVK